MPTSGDVYDLLTEISASRGRPMHLLVAPLGSSVSGLLVSTNHADYVVVAEGSSPERQCAIVCHEVAHSLLGHSHDDPPGSSLVDSGLLQGVDPKLARNIVEIGRASCREEEYSYEE